MLKALVHAITTAIYTVCDTLIAHIVVFVMRTEAVGTDVRRDDVH
jgi:hypothetical protein